VGRPARVTSRESGAATADAGTSPLARRLEEYRFPAGYRRMFLAAAGAFAEKGYHGTSTREIAARAGMSPAALYAFFSTKEDVLYKIAMSALDLTVEMLTVEANRGETPGERLRDVVTVLTAWYAYGSPVARVVFYQLDALTEEHLAEVLVKKRAIDQIVRGVIADGVSTGEFAVSDVTAVATAVMSLCVDVARWYRPGRRRTPESIAEVNARAALRGWLQTISLIYTLGPVGDRSDGSR
jgi:AcrR family transcriptional regulator